MCMCTGIEVFKKAWLLTKETARRALSGSFVNLATTHAVSMRAILQGGLDCLPEIMIDLFVS